MARQILDFLFGNREEFGKTGNELAILIFVGQKHDHVIFMQFGKCFEHAGFANFIQSFEHRGLNLRKRNAVFGNFYILMNQRILCGFHRISGRDLTAVCAF